MREILDRWSIERIDQVVDVSGLMGDASDNMQRVPDPENGWLLRVLTAWKV